MHADKWAIKAKQSGFKTRAVFKLEEILIKTNSLKGNQKILDIGSAPGGWSHYLKLKLPKSEIKERFKLEHEILLLRHLGLSLPRQKVRTMRT